MNTPARFFLLPLVSLLMAACGSPQLTADQEAAEINAIQAQQDANTTRTTVDVAGTSINANTLDTNVLVCAGHRALSPGNPNVNDPNYGRGYAPYLGMQMEVDLVGEPNVIFNCSGPHTWSMVGEISYSEGDDDSGWGPSTAPVGDHGVTSIAFPAEGPTTAQDGNSSFMYPPTTTLPQHRVNATWGWSTDYASQLPTLFVTDSYGTVAVPCTYGTMGLHHRF